MKQNKILFAAFLSILSVKTNNTTVQKKRPFGFNIHGNMYIPLDDDALEFVVGSQVASGSYLSDMVFSFSGGIRFYDEDISAAAILSIPLIGNKLAGTAKEYIRHTCLSVHVAWELADIPNLMLGFQANISLSGVGVGVIISKKINRYEVGGSLFYIKELEIWKDKDKNKDKDKVQDKKQENKSQNKNESSQNILQQNVSNRDRGAPELVEDFSEILNQDNQKLLNKAHSILNTIISNSAEVKPEKLFDNNGYKNSENFTDNDSESEQGETSSDIDSDNETELTFDTNSLQNIKSKNNNKNYPLMLRFKDLQQCFLEALKKSNIEHIYELYPINFDAKLAFCSCRDVFQSTSNDWLTLFDDLHLLSLKNKKTKKNIKQNIIENIKQLTYFKVFEKDIISEVNTNIFFKTILDDRIYKDNFFISTYPGSRKKVLKDYLDTRINQQQIVKNCFNNNNNLDVEKLKKLHPNLFIINDICNFKDQTSYFENQFNPSKYWEDYINYLREHSYLKNNENENENEISKSIKNWIVKNNSINIEEAKSKLGKNFNKVIFQSLCHEYLIEMESIIKKIIDGREKEIESDFFSFEEIENIIRNIEYDLEILKIRNVSYSLACTTLNGWMEKNQLHLNCKILNPKSLYCFANDHFFENQRKEDAIIRMNFDPENSLVKNKEIIYKKIQNESFYHAYSEDDVLTILKNSWPKEDQKSINEEIDKLKKELKGCQRQISKNQAQKQAQQAEIDKLKQEKQIKDELINNIENGNDVDEILKKERERLEDTIRELENKISDENKKFTEKLEEEKNNYSTQLKELEEKEKQNIAYIKEIEDQQNDNNNKIKDLEETKSQLEKNKQELQNDLDTSQQPIDELNKQIQSLTEEIDKKDEEIKLLEEKNNALTSEIDRLQLENKEKDEEINQLNNEILDLKKQIEDSEKQNNQLSDQISDLEDEIEKNNILIEEMQQQIDHSNSTNEDKGKKVDELEKELLELKSKSIENSKSIELQKELEAKQIIIDSLKSNNNEGILQKIESLQEENAKNNEKIQALTFKIEVVENEKEELEAEKEDLNQKIENLESKIKELRENQNENKNKIQNSLDTNQIESFQNQNENNSKQIQALIQENNELKAENEIINKKINQSTKQSFTKDIKALKKELKKTKMEYEALANENTKLSNYIEILEKSIIEKDLKIKQLEETNQKLPLLKSQLESQQEDILKEFLEELKSLDGLNKEEKENVETALEFFDEFIKELKSLNELNKGKKDNVATAVKIISRNHPKPLRDSYKEDSKKQKEAQSISTPTNTSQPLRNSSQKNSNDVKLHPSETYKSSFNNYMEKVCKNEKKCIESFRTSLRENKDDYSAKVLEKINKKTKNEEVLLECKKLQNQCDNNNQKRTLDKLKNLLNNNQKKGIPDINDNFEKEIRKLSFYNFFELWSFCDQDFLRLIKQALEIKKIKTNTVNTKEFFAIKDTNTKTFYDISCEIQILEQIVEACQVLISKQYTNATKILTTFYKINIENKKFIMQKLNLNPQGSDSQDDLKNVDNDLKERRLPINRTKYPTNIVKEGAGIRNQDKITKETRKTPNEAKKDGKISVYNVHKNYEEKKVKNEIQAKVPIKKTTTSKPVVTAKAPATSKSVNEPIKKTKSAIKSSASSRSHSKKTPASLRSSSYKATSSIRSVPKKKKNTK